MRSLRIVRFWRTLAADPEPLSELHPVGIIWVDRPDRGPGHLGVVARRRHNWG
jgi:hypothetical protein